MNGINGMMAFWLKISFNLLLARNNVRHLILKIHSYTGGKYVCAFACAYVFWGKGNMGCWGKEIQKNRGVKKIIWFRIFCSLVLCRQGSIWILLLSKRVKAINFWNIFREVRSIRHDLSWYLGNQVRVVECIRPVTLAILVVHIDHYIVKLWQSCDVVEYYYSGSGNDRH